MSSTSAFAGSTAGPSTFGDWIANFYNPMVETLLSAPRTITQSSVSAVVASDDTALIFNATAAVNLTLPASSVSQGRKLDVKTIAAFGLNSTASNVVPSTGSTGQSTILSGVVGKWAELRCDGTNWVIMKSN